MKLIHSNISHVEIYHEKFFLNLYIEKFLKI